MHQKKKKKKKKKKHVLRLSKLSYCEMSFTFAGLYNAMSSSHQTSIWAGIWF